MDHLTDYYDTQFRESVSTGSIYEPLTILLDAAHHYRMATLDALPIGSLGGKTVVDFGTGSWGFGCIFPQLQNCYLAIGIDISVEAVRISESVSANGGFAYGDRYKYYVSDGHAIPLLDASVDVFFTGECIEHVENTDAFLDEIYRVLAPDGILILTTPNPDPILYRSFGDSYAVGPEHIALMTLPELSAYLEPRFNMEIVKGYNTSLHPSLDVSVKDTEFAKYWAAAHENHPQDACGIIVMARKKFGWKPKKYRKTTYFSGDAELVKLGKWDDVGLHQNLRGLCGNAGSDLTLYFEGSEIIALLWMHDWSGIAEVEVDGVVQRIDLFCSAGGFKRVIFKNLDEKALHKITIHPTGEKNQRSMDAQVIFFSASVYVES